MNKNKEAIEKDTTKTEDSFGEQITGIFIVISALIAISGLGVFIYQCFLWLKYGHWTSYSANLFLTEGRMPKGFLEWLANDSSSWLGVKKIILFIFDFPLGWFLFLLGLVLICLIGSLSDSFSKSKTSKNNN